VPMCDTLMPNGDDHFPGSRSSGVSRVLIVDDHPVLRRGLRASVLTSEDFEVVGEASSGEEAIRLFQQLRPDITLMDLLMPGMGGVSAIRAIREIAPDAKIMVVSTSEEGDLVHEAFQAGAIGYQLKGMEIDELVSAIRQAVSGITSLAPAAARSLVQTTSTAHKLGDDLTDREREVLALLAQGLSNKVIAEHMVVAEATVKFHLRHVRSKLGTKSRTQTVAVAIQNHLVDNHTT
jgi:NarL family two-component system response regulator LiaR